MAGTVGFIFAHPDDETFGSACLIRRTADEGGRAVLLLATRGDAGKSGRLGPMTQEQLAARRDREMERAAGILGLAAVEQLGYSDGRLSEADPQELTNRIVSFVHQYRPEVLVTFPEDGVSGHPDHAAIHRATRRAVADGGCPSVRKLYYYASPVLLAEGRSPSISIDTEPYWEMKARALAAHESQILSIERVFGNLRQFPEERRYESFVLAWERGVWWPVKRERTIWDDSETAGSSRRG